jgi:hypothetical protein
MRVSWKSTLLSRKEDIRERRAVVAHATRNRFTVYDVMQSRGVFDDNEANVISPAYKGPVPWPRVYYHPKGEERILVPADTRVTPWGPERLMEQREIIWRKANNQEEADKLIAEGWHDHPAKAIVAGGGVPPPMGSAGRITDLEQKIRDMERELAAAREGMRAAPAPETVPATVPATIPVTVTATATTPATAAASKPTLSPSAVSRG